VSGVSPSTARGEGSARLRRDLEAELEAMSAAGTLKSFEVLASPQGPEVELRGRGRAIVLSSNDYLGLAADPEVIAAGHEALDRYGAGTASVRFICGLFEPHLELERGLAEFLGSEAALTYTSCWNANHAVLDALCDAGTHVYSDELNHASIIDGVRLTKARRFIYKHNDPADLRAKLAEGAGARRKLIITDGVFSMDGDIAPLDAIVDEAEKAGAMVMVDDAHGEGVLGDHGKGIVDHFHLHGRVEVEVGTLSKAFGVVGGFVTGPRVLIDFLRQKARPFLFSSAVTPPDVAASIAAVEILSRTDEPVKKLWANGRALKDGFRKAGFDIGHSQTPITPVILGEATTAREFSKRLFDEESIFAQAIAFPTVPKGTARIRCMVSAAHSPQDIDRAVASFTRIGKAMGVLQ